MYHSVCGCGIVHGDLTGVNALIEVVVSSVTHLFFTVEYPHQRQRKGLLVRFRALETLYGSYG